MAFLCILEIAGSDLNQDWSREDSEKYWNLPFLGAWKEKEQFSKLLNFNVYFKGFDLKIFGAYLEKHKLKTLHNIK